MMLTAQTRIEGATTFPAPSPRYAEDVANLFEESGIHSALWIWRSYRKDKWGFELVHEDSERRETVDVKMMNTLDRVWRAAAALRLLPGAQLPASSSASSAPAPLPPLSAPQSRPRYLLRQANHRHRTRRCRRCRRHHLLRHRLPCLRLTCHRALQRLMSAAGRTVLP